MILNIIENILSFIIGVILGGLSIQASEKIDKKEKKEHEKK